ncbi:MAG TPA: T9SS type A sorting domain-containing protein [Flavobacteriales bacterium]|nr:T9SS type A sorting domain-containing protein [Flavobacteriales bacterium]
MKLHTLRLLVLLAFTGSRAIAQPVVTNAIPGPGVAFEMRSISSTVSLAPAGINQTWDYSTLSSSALFTIEWVDVATVPAEVQDTFPNANRATMIDLGAGQIYRMYETTSTDFLDWGEKGSGSSWQVFDDPHYILHYGLSYGNSYYDAATNYTIKYEGYGTLITPFGTYTDVIFTKEHLGGTDTLYNFCSFTPHYQRLMAYSNTSSGVQWEYFFKPVAGSGLTENKEEVSFELFPNPGNDHVCITLNKPEKATVKIIQPDGKVVFSNNLQEKQNRIITTALPHGFYLVMVSTSGGNAVKTWIK